jgi:hypothetical protein
VHPILTGGAAFAELGGDLAGLGLRYVQGVGAGASLPEGRSVAMYRPLRVRDTLF